MRLRYFLVIILAFICIINSKAQVSIREDINNVDYSDPQEYEIGGITVTGVSYLDNNVLIVLSGLSVGQKLFIPGDEITRAVEKLWKQGLFENIKISVEKKQGRTIFLNIDLLERSRLSKYSFDGISRADADKIRDIIKLVRGDVVTDNVIIRTKNSILTYFNDKGYLNAEVDIIQKVDTATENTKMLFININKNSKVKINQINVRGNEYFSDEKIKKSLKDTKEQGVFKPFDVLDTLLLNTPKYVLRLDPKGLFQTTILTAKSKLKLRIFKSSKFIEDDFYEDKKALIEKYNELGFRDAKIINDSIYNIDDHSINIDITVDEGKKYYFRNINWLGNTKYTSEELNFILKIRKGDIYNQKILDANLSFNPEGFDVSSLYLDDGYLFFQAVPVEVLVENDSIDIEIRIREGKQARINKISIKGNVKTNDHVIIREIRTKPGQLFSRSDIIRTTRELAQLKYFNPETLNPVPKPNPVDGTVDIVYEVEETSADQIELSGGWGYGRIIGTLGVSFNNFSTRNIFKKNSWRPIPAGDGQKLSLRLQSYGVGYFSYSASFTEPWLGGKKPNSLSVTYFHSLYTNSLPKADSNRATFIINGVSVGLGRRLKWPDDFFTLYQSLNFQNYVLDNYGGIFSFNTGYSNNFNYGIIISRNSIDAPIYPRSGSEVSLSLNVTPPYSAFQNKNYLTMEDAEKYKWIEYHKWKIKIAWFTKLVGNLVMSSRFKFGFLGSYNKELGVTPFERFYLGGDGLSGYNNMDGRELIGLRGYGNNTLTPGYPNSIGGTIYDKFTFELRYPLSLNPSATIYGMAFLEAGNAWIGFDKFNPFQVYRAVGFGVRIFLPMFGILGLDWGYGIDEVPGIPGANGGQFHFSINQSID